MSTGSISALTRRLERQSQQHHDLRFAWLENRGEVQSGRPALGCNAEAFVEAAIAEQCVTGWTTLQAVRISEYGEPQQDAEGKWWPTHDRGKVLIYGPDRSALAAFNETARQVAELLDASPLAHGACLQPLPALPDADHAFAVATRVMAIARNAGDAALPHHEGPIELGDDALVMPGPRPGYCYQPKDQNGRAPFGLLVDLQRNLPRAAPHLHWLGASLWEAAIRALELAADTDDPAPANTPTDDRPIGERVSQHIRAKREEGVEPTDSQLSRDAIANALDVSGGSVSYTQAWRALKAERQQSTPAGREDAALAAAKRGDWSAVQRLQEQEDKKRFIRLTRRSLRGWRGF